MTDVTVTTITDDTDKTTAAVYTVLTDGALELFRRRIGNTTRTDEVTGE
jgi:hypothetical protein